jgi:ribosomal protein L13
MSETILLEAKTYTLQQYAEQVAKKHPNTVISMIKKGMLPSNHHVILGKQYIITVQPPIVKRVFKT